METRPIVQRLLSSIYFIISMGIQADKPKRLRGIHITTKEHRLAVSNWFQVLKHPTPSKKKKSILPPLHKKCIQLHLKKLFYGSI